MTQDQLADAAGLHVRTIRGIETQRITAPHRDSVGRLVAALHLSLEVEESLLWLWSIRDHSPLVGARRVFGRRHGSSDQLESITRDHMGGLRVLTLSISTTVGAGRRITHHDLESSLVALRNGIQRNWVFLQPDDPTVELYRVSVSRLRNCSVGREILFPEEGIKAVELLLPEALATGQAAALRYRIDYGNAQKAGCDPTRGARRSMTGFLRPAASCVAEVNFDPAALPSQCEQLYQRRPGVAPVPVRTLTPNSWHAAQIVIVAPTPGAHGIRWAW